MVAFFITSTVPNPYLKQQYMDTEIPSGVIRRIIVGMSPKDGMSFTVGQMMGSLIISAIIKDKNYFYKFGQVRFLIYVRKGISGEERLWKESISVPVTIEYDTDNLENLV